MRVAKQNEKKCTNNSLQNVHENDKLFDPNLLV